jgi:multisubunit Na+/H+ antiporter MnhB subunit
MVAVTRLRWVVIAVCVAAIPTMIVGSVLDRNGIALTAGLLAATAIGCLLVATTVAPMQRPVSAEDEGARVEALIGELTAQGADEATTRALAQAAVRLGRAQAGASERSENR